MKKTARFTLSALSVALAGAVGCFHSGSAPAPAPTPWTYVVAYPSDAQNLMPYDANGFRDVFVDTFGGQTLARERASENRYYYSHQVTQTMVPNGSSTNAVVSADGRFVAFESAASLVDDPLGHSQICVYDRALETQLLEATQTMTLVSRQWPGSTNHRTAVGNGASRNPSISANGQWIAFETDASNLLSGVDDFTGVTDIFVSGMDVSSASAFISGTGRRCGVVGVTFRADFAANGHSRNPSISSDGRWVAFESDASNLVAGDSNGVSDIFVFDKQTLQFTRVSVATNGAEANRSSRNPSISGDGTCVAFETEATNLDPSDTGIDSDIYVHRMGVGTFRASFGGAGDARNPSISWDARYVAFDSDASDLILGDTNNVRDVFVCDYKTGWIRRLSLTVNGAESSGPAHDPCISPDARYVSYLTEAQDVLPGPQNGFSHIVIKETFADGTLTAGRPLGALPDGSAQAPSISGPLAVSQDPPAGVGGIWSGVPTPPAPPSAPGTGFAQTGVLGSAQAIALYGSFVILAGYEQAPPPSSTMNWRIEKRWASDGAMAGFVSDSSAYGEINALAVDPANGFIYVAGYTPNTAGTAWSMKIYDMSLNEKKSSVDFLSSPLGEIEALAFDPVTSSVYVVGYEIQSAHNIWRVQKLSYSQGDWKIDGQFAGEGAFQGAFWGVPHGAVVAAGGLYIVGDRQTPTYNTTPGPYKWCLKKLQSNGFEDTAFGQGGEVVRSNWQTYSSAQAIATDGSGLLVAGWGASNIVYATTLWRTEKLDLGGGYIQSFGSVSTPGYAISNSQGEYPYLFRMGALIDGSGHYAGGTEGVASAGSDYRWRVEKRGSDGSLNPYGTFSPSGSYVQNPSSGGDFLCGMAVDAAWLYLAGSAVDTTQTYTPSRWRFEKAAK